MFPLGGEGVGAPFSALFRRADGSLAAVSGLGRIVLGSGTTFSLVPEMVPDFVAVDAAEDSDGSLLLGGYEGTICPWTPLPIPEDLTGPPRMVRYDGATFEDVDLGTVECDAIVGNWISGTGGALVLCWNGNVLRREGSGWISLAPQLPYEVATGGFSDFFGILGDGPSNIIVYGVIPPILGKDPTIGIFYHFDGSVWTTIDYAGQLSPKAVWGNGPNDVTALVTAVSGYSCNLAIAHFDGTAWTNIETLLEAPAAGTCYTTYPTKPLVLGDDVYLATLYGIYHGAPTGWGLLPEFSPGGPRNLAADDDGVLYVTTDDGKIFRRVCP